MLEEVGLNLSYSLVPNCRGGAGAVPGLIWGCCKVLQKKIDHRNDIICRKINRLLDSAKSKKLQFWLE